MAAEFPLPPATLPSRCPETGGEHWASQVPLPTDVSPQSTADGWPSGIFKPVYQGTLGTWFRVKERLVSTRMQPLLSCLDMPWQRQPRGKTATTTACPETPQGCAPELNQPAPRPPWEWTLTAQIRPLFLLPPYLPPSCYPGHGAEME